MPARNYYLSMPFIVLLVCMICPSAHALEISQARAVMHDIFKKTGVTATENHGKPLKDGSIEFTYSDVRIPLSNQLTQRTVVFANTIVKIRDTKKTNQVDLNISLPNKGMIEGEKPSEAQDITLKNAGAYLRWDRAYGDLLSFDGSADLLAIMQPIIRKHTLAQNIVLRWMPELVQVSLQNIEWTGPNEEKQGSAKSIDMTLSPDTHPGEKGGTSFVYDHEGLWVPGLFRPRTVRIEASDKEVKWQNTKPLLGNAFKNLLRGVPIDQIRRDITFGLWQQAANSPSPINFQMLYLEGDGLEALGNGHLFAMRQAAYGFAGILDFQLRGKQRLQTLLGTPAQPTILGALFPYAVDGLAAAKPGPKGIDNYQLSLSDDGSVSVNGKTVVGPKSQH